MKNYIIPSIIVVAFSFALSQTLLTTPEKKAVKRSIRQKKEAMKTKAFLEKKARSEIDFLSKKYDINILQDELNKKKFPKNSK